MNILNIKNKIFNFLKYKKYNLLFNLIKSNESLNLDIQDINYNYLIDYLIMDNQIEIIEYILKNNKIRLDILDADNKIILYK